MLYSNLIKMLRLKKIYFFKMIYLLKLIVYKIKYKKNKINALGYIKKIKNIALIINFEIERIGANFWHENERILSLAKNSLLKN